MEYKLKKPESLSLIFSILFLILGILLFTDSGAMVNYINYIFGALLVLVGIIRFMIYSKLVEKTMMDLSSAIIPIVFGVIIIMFSSVFEFLLRVVIGGWIIYWGLKRLMETIKLSELEANTKIKTTLLLLDIGMIGCGIYVIAVSNLVLSMIGLFIIIYAVIDIVTYIIKTTQKQK